MNATLSLEIPRDVLESAHMTVADAKLELAIALFAANQLSLGKAAELAGLPVVETRPFDPGHTPPPRGHLDGIMCKT